MAEDVYIPTIDPAQGGGVLSVTEFTYETASKAGYDPHLIYNATSWEECVTVRDILKGQFTPRSKQLDREGMDGTMIGRQLPESESLGYLLNYRQWQQTLGEGITFGVGGVALSCLPLAIANESYSCWVGTLLRDERKVQVDNFATPRRVRYQLERPILNRLEGKTLRQADRLFVQSTYTKRRIHDEYGIPTADIEYLPYPIDTDHFVPDSTGDAGTELVFVGRFNDPRKNIGLLLRAFAKVRQTVPDATLTLIGDEPDETTTQLLSELGINDAVRTPGLVPEIVPYLQQADVFVLPSRQEGLGIAGLEAMSCGLPVVATACGGPEDYVQDGETGFLVPTDDAKALAERVIDLLTNHDLRQQLGANARDLIEHQYAASKIQDRLLDIFTDML